MTLNFFFFFFRNLDSSHISHLFTDIDLFHSNLDSRMTLSVMTKKYTKSGSKIIQEIFQKILSFEDLNNMIFVLQTITFLCFSY